MSIAVSDLPSPWSKEAPTETGAYWARNHSVGFGEGKWPTPSEASILVYFYKGEVQPIGSSVKFLIDEFRAEWAKAEPPK